MYSYKEFKEVFDKWDEYNIGDSLEVNGKKVVIVDEDDKGYDYEGQCEELLVISIDGENYAAIRYSSSYESLFFSQLIPVTKKTKTVEYWE